MNEPDGHDTFDLEPPPPEAEAAELPVAPAAPHRTAPRGREDRPARGRRRRRADAPAPPATGGGFGAFVFGCFTSPRWLYALSAVLATTLLFLLYNPGSGLQAKTWFWEALRGGHHPYLHAWNPHLLQAVVLPLICLGLFAAALSRPGGGRGRWAAFWVVVAFVTFMIRREELRIFLGPVVAVVGLGVVIRRARGEANARATWIALLVLASFLFLPLPEARTNVGRGAGHPVDTSYHCQAIGIVELLIDAPGDASESGLLRRVKLFLQELPQYVALLTFVLLLAVLLGARGRWPGIAAGVVLLGFLAAYTWLQFDLGLARDVGRGRGDPTWWAGAHQVADTWRARFFAFMPALAAATAEVSWPRRETAP